MNGNHIRKLTAPISVILFVLIFSVSFLHYYGQSVEQPILLNTKFKYLTKDPETQMVSPYLWEVVYYKGEFDKAFIRRDFVDGVGCIGLHVYQDGINDTNVWATIHIKQAVGGRQLQRLFDSRIGVWVYPTFQYIYDKETKNPENVFGLEVNDGTHIVWFIFSDDPIAPYTLKNHHIIVIQTPLNKWSYREVSIREVYDDQGWTMPESVSFIILMGATRSLKGEFSGYIREVIVEEEAENNRGFLGLALWPAIPTLC